MRKIIAIVITFVCLSFIFSACSKSESYADKLKKERKAIKRLINEKNIKLIYDYPKDGVFGENEYYVDNKYGFYLHVVDSGNGNRATHGTEIYVRYKETYAFNYDANTEFKNTDQAGLFDLLNFTFGNPTTYTSWSSTEGFSNYYCKSAAVANVLNHVGENAIVKLLVPFDGASGFQQSTYQPLYYGYIRYEFRPGQEK